MLTSRHLVLPLVVSTALFVGCRASVETPPAESRPTLRYNRTVRSENERLKNYAYDIQSARDRIQEAEAIMRFQNHLSDEKLTYQVSGVRTLDDRPVDVLSSSKENLRVRVEVFRGQQPLEAFTFVPKDNRNLALLGR